MDFLDDNSLLAVGKIEQLKEIEDKYEGLIGAIGNPEIKKKIYRRLKYPLSLVHPSAVVSTTAIICSGCVIEAQAVVNSEAIVKDSSFICAGTVANHNSVVGEFCQIDCNVVVVMGAEVSKDFKVASCSVFRKIEMAREHENDSFFQ